MSRLVLDTNCLIQIVSPRSKYHSLWMSFVRGEYELCVSNEIVDEYLEILQKLTSVEVAEYIMKTIINSPFVVFIDPFYKFDLIQADKDDNKFVDCAIAAQARCIISNDHHYDILSTIPFPHVEVIKLTDFMEIMKASGN
ncbi:putative toxin-antitoxin system toxin component, PIN family [Prevotella sp.]|mgnify:FL=1|uniref:putative toxin-antitoxin system toxin component, PIN family n=1 Tax=Prevotella sp. TaxID=59823 RepID=UPI0025D6D63E|nr:putative toxin-antitoxin system toxin component, PIN family [Prevotella sp.]MCI7372162.1 putative toxin-antitoxin system toxin component, PIN family [Prevotella sp.]MEE1385182.1 putative toxin-antitoxin system toxin component, PIN family [Prevotella sp.]